MKKLNKFNVVIITCWILLLIALLLKLFGLNWFEPKTENETFINFCNYIESKMVLKIIITCIISLILNTLSVLAILGQGFYTKIQALVFIPIIIASSVVSWYVPAINITLGIIIYLLPIIWLKRKWYRAIIGVGLILAFQAISLLAKNIGCVYVQNYNYYFVDLILNIDNFLMCLIYYLYATIKFKRKED